MRSVMTDAEFWEHVFGGAPMEPEVDFDADDDADRIRVPCSLCGEFGACGYDEQGRPLIHATDEADDE